MMQNSTSKSGMAPSANPLARFKEAQREGWAHFAPLEALTTPPAAELVRRASPRAGQRVLDVACGTGVVAVTAARLGARVTGLDLTPELLERARENARIAAVDIEWHQGDVEQLPFADGTYDMVLSQFGHIFAPRPDVAIAEMLRVLQPGGTIAFSTWPPELCVGRLFALTGRYLPPPPPGVVPPNLWGDPNVVRERLGDAVKDLRFDRATMRVPALSLQHNRTTMEKTAGPVLKLVESLTASDSARLETYRREFEATVADYFENNVVRQDYLITRATKT
jgi:2-polyprenyl-3-methyl-5-hydroxy-6-metoxy-1,4-benzoquinol methylase